MAQPLRSIRVPEYIWQAAKEEAERRGESLNAAIVRLLAAYARVDEATSR
ncbi:hypothetical protein GCM10023169_30230 [Georgenia halophila]|uniref:Arc family DNA-binding protein n=1 Tax=Georgenia halophila TaxID=620889 RepID=A0ABP8LGY9_9MICO